MVFLVVVTRFASQLRNGLSKLGISKEILEVLFSWVVGSGNYPKIPDAKGSVKAVQNEAFFIPLYELYLRYGGIFRLNFGPKVGLS